MNMVRGHAKEVAQQRNAAKLADKSKTQSGAEVSSNIALLCQSFITLYIIVKKSQGGRIKSELPSL